MKAILLSAAALLLVLLLMKMADNQTAPEPVPGVDFSLMAQTVVACSPTEITLADRRQVKTQLEKDQSWPDCSHFPADTVMDFNLSHGEKTYFVSAEPTSWWRKLWLKTM